MTQISPSRQWSTEAETLCFGAVFLLRVQDGFRSLRDQWAGPYTIKSWMRTFPLTKHWRLVMDGSSSIAPTQNILPEKWLKKEHIKVRKWPSRSPDLSGRSWGVCAKRQQKDLKHLESVHKEEWAKTFPGMCLNLRKVLALCFPTRVSSLSTKLWSNTYFTQLHTKLNYHKMSLQSEQT